MSQKKGLNKPLVEQLVDQAAHIVAGAALTTLLGLWLGPVSVLAGVYIGWSYGLLKEVGEGGRFWSGGSLLDQLGWAVGGALAGWQIV